MVLSMDIKLNDSVSKSVAIIGSNAAALQAAFTLAQMGVDVNMITTSAALGWNGATENVSGNSPLDQRFLWPLLLRATNHPLVTLYTNAEVESIDGEKGDFKIQVLQHPRYVHEDLCTGCGSCQIECSVKITSLLGEQKMTHTAIHTPLLGAKAVPSAYVIDRNKFSPCRVACPLGINVQGFVSLLANGKTDKALELINESAPLAGILGRVCRHPCEDRCNRAEIDSSVSIRALHRYAADNAPRGIKYSRKFPAWSRDGKIAIIGSGPAGLTAAWELSRLSYTPVVFESHGVIGGMLATGIPRFRIPREVREREIEAIRNMGIDIRTGITVGRDIPFAYLKERGYKAFFLSIGAQRNNKLNIPGEYLEGVVDCISLLLTLNLKLDTFVGLNVVVIGDGNSAVDSARTANRKNEGKVSVLSWTIPEEITATKEEVEEALLEGVSIEYCTMPIEILGDGGKVTGIRCQRTRLTEDIMPNGRHRPEPIPGTDFIIDADHVVVAIGQSPNAPQLDMEGLAIDSSTGIIKANPLTLETSIPGVFAGGDCVTGPNNVVEAMAAGLRAAESIDRHMQGRDLKVGRSLEQPETATVDVETIEVSPYKRAQMPVIHPRRRMNSFEETTTGLSTEAARRESQRCLNCALCSQCMECTRVCELGAIFHNEDIKHFEIGAQVVLKFPSISVEEDTLADKADQEATTKGVHIVAPGSNVEVIDQVLNAMALAMEATIEIKPREAQEIQIQHLTQPDAKPVHPQRISEQIADTTERIGVFLCRCGGGISSIIDFRTVTRKLSRLHCVTCVREIAQACSEAGAKEIKRQAIQWQLDRLVIAACRCCNSEQVCYSCTDRRIMCQQYLNEHLILPHNTIIEFVNIREHCAWVHSDTPKHATRKAVQMISAGVARVWATPSITLRKESILPAALIVGGELTDITAARALASRGYQVDIIARQRTNQGQDEHSGATLFMLEQLQDKGITVRTWPDALELHGSPGNYDVVLEHGSQVDHIPTGALLVDMEELNKGAFPLLNTTSSKRFLDQIILRAGNLDYLASTGADLLREVTIKKTSGIFLLPSDIVKLQQDQVQYGLAAAARISTYLEQTSITPRAMAVTIDSQLCRGCGNCADICPYIEMREHDSGLVYAYIDNALCLGCGACIPSCPSGAITQPLQSDKQLVSTLRSMLPRGQIFSEV